MPLNPHVFLGTEMVLGVYQQPELHLDNCLLMMHKLAIRRKHETCAVHFTSSHVGLPT